MSVLIKDMEMPETCDDCPFHVYHSHYEYVCKATPMFYPMNLANSKGIRKDWCPLSEAPEPCEDAVSRQAALDVIFPYCPDDDGTCSKNGDDLRNLLDDIENLPSVQPKPIRINLNESIKVKLTDWGKEIYYHQYDRTNQIAGREVCKPNFPKEDEDGYTEFQLWCFIELYGMHMGMTLPNVIEPLEIVYER